MLGNLIIKQLPIMSKQIEKRLANVQKQILQLPPELHVSSNPLETVFDLMVGLTDEIKNIYRTEESDFWQDAMTEFQIFYDNLEKLKPRFAKVKQ